MLALRLDEYEIPQAKVQHAARHGSNVAVEERIHEHNADAASDVQRREAVEGLLVHAQNHLSKCGAFLRSTTLLTSPFFGSRGTRPPRPTAAMPPSIIPSNSIRLPSHRRETQRADGAALSAIITPFWCNRHWAFQLQPGA